MQRFEANTTKLLTAVTYTLKSLQAKLSKTTEVDHASVQIDFNLGDQRVTLFPSYAPPQIPRPRIMLC
jgi:hypothetical protein